MNIPYSAPIFHVYISVFLGWTLVPGSKRRRQLGAALVPVPLGGTQLGGVGSKTGTSARSRRDDWQGLVNVPFLGYWTPPFNGHYRWYTSWLGDVQLGRLMTHDWWVHSARHGGIFLQQKAWIGHKKMWFGMIWTSCFLENEFDVGESVDWAKVLSELTKALTKHRGLSHKLCYRGSDNKSGFWTDNKMTYPTKSCLPTHMSFWPTQS